VELIAHLHTVKDLGPARHVQRVKIHGTTNGAFPLSPMLGEVVELHPSVSRFHHARSLHLETRSRRDLIDNTYRIVGNMLLELCRLGQVLGKRFHVYIYCPQETLNTRMTPSETKAITQKINADLSPITDKFQAKVPVPELTAILRKYDLDPKGIQNNLSDDSGRMHIPVGKDIYLTMTWYKFHTGRFEIVAYVSSAHDDHKDAPIAKVMDAGEKRKAVAAVSKDLNTISGKYWKALGLVTTAISDALAAVGFDSGEFEDQMVHSTAGKKQGRIHVPVGNGIYLAMQFFKMEQTGNFEITAYVS